MHITAFELHAMISAGQAESDGDAANAENKGRLLLLVKDEGDLAAIWRPPAAAGKDDRGQQARIVGFNDERNVTPG